MVIRKLSIGPDYKSGAIHYFVGQEILGGSHTIHLIKHNKGSDTLQIWIKKGNEIFLWKEYNHTMPVSLEYNINF